MDKFTVIETFMALLKKAKYSNEVAFSKDTFDDTLFVLELDRDNVFKAMYGEKMMKNRGTNKIKEYDYRLIEAQRDVKSGYIKNTMHYLLTQIKIGDLKL